MRHLSFPFVIAVAVTLAGCGGDIVVPDGSQPTHSDVAPTAEPPSPSAMTDHGSTVPILTPVPTPASPDVSIPKAVADAFIASILAGDYEAAWALLSVDAQAHFNGVDDFASDRKAFMATAENQAIVSEPTNAPDQLATWLQGLDAASLDASRAFVVEVHFPVLVMTKADPQVLIVGPDRWNEWRIWIAR